MSIDNLVSFRPRRLESPPRKARTGWTIGDVRISEVVAVLRAIGSGRVWPGRGWWHPAQRRHDWNWLAARHGVDPNGAIMRQNFLGSAGFFERLDRDGDGLLTAADLECPDYPRPRRAPLPMRLGLLYSFVRGEFGSLQEGPELDQEAPDFTLPLRNGSGRRSLSEYRGKKPVVLALGSFT